MIKNPISTNIYNITGFKCLYQGAVWLSFLFKVKLPYEEFIAEAQKFKVPLKFYTITLDQVTMYMLVPIGSSGLMYMYFCEENCDQKKLDKTMSELQRLGFTKVESFELPLP